jgi:MYXO-CTERM domain-containing protein
MRLHTFFSGFFGAAAAVALLGSVRPAQACGGCLAPPAENTVVEGHRMALSISKTQTVLWDQFRYTGNPTEFAWVLPIRGTTRVELANDEFFAALDATSQPIITAPTPTSRGGGGGCSSSSSFSATTPGSTDQDPVQVVKQEVVGPYEVVTLKSSNANALNDWLTTRGYAIPASVKPVISAYVTEGFDFVALRLLPNQNVNAMQPVRVVTQGADATLPLRMVAAGVGAKVGIVLYVIGEGRYETANYPGVTIDATKLTWDANASRSNYTELVDGALSQGEGRGWFTEYAYPMLLERVGSRVGYFRSIPTLQEAYASATQGGKCKQPPSSDGGLPKIDGGSLKDASSDDASADASDDGALDASSDGGPSDGGDAGPGDGGTKPTCAYDDIDVATLGMYPSDVWVTRLRANLPVAALDRDLKLQAASSQTKNDALYQAGSGPAFDPGDGCSTAPGGTGDSMIVALGLGALGASVLLRRRRST